ncbi:hypothetical protein RRG08_040565 [Elysia crispata]|uniref:Uncharacterized protein n=1 Tax=Elysia crispata TaxID=231223 RepID=A0AAE0Z843_9GAST|nr:hypothetical protein RRG08_040565 [Elysia crispata]
MLRSSKATRFSEVWEGQVSGPPRWTPLWLACLGLMQSSAFPATRYDRYPLCPAFTFPPPKTSLEERMVKDEEKL